MGKNKQPAPWQWKRSSEYAQAYSQSGYGKSWQLWQGAWSPRNRATPPTRYDQVATEEDQRVRSGATEAQPSVLTGMDTSVLQAVQKVLTQARRIDARVRKIKEEKVKRTKQWDIYAKDMRAKYLKQQQTFQQDMQKLDQEEAAAISSGTESAQLLTMIVTTGQRPPVAPADTGPDAWDQLLQEDTEMTEPDGFLAHAQALISRAHQMPPSTAFVAAPDNVGSPPSLGSGPPGGPSPGHPPQQPMPPNPSMNIHRGQAAPNPVPAGVMPTGYHAASPGSCSHRAAPFPVSPSHPPLRTEDIKYTETATVEQTAAAAAISATRSPLPAREPVKEATKNLPPKATPEGVSLGQKLEHKREAMKGTATMPFRVPPPGLGTSPEHVDTGEPPGPTAPPNIVDDDIEELNTAFFHVGHNLPNPRSAVRGHFSSSIYLGWLVTGLDFAWQVDSPILHFPADDHVLLVTLLQCVPADGRPDEHLFDTAVPIKPQRFSAAGSFLRFSSSIRGVGVGGLVAVILDLTHVGGHYFAAVLPQDIHYRTLQEYFLPLTTLDEDPSDVYIGYRDEPWPPQTDVKLTDGDVITVLKQPGGSFHKYRVSTLFEPGAHWNHPKHLFHLNFCTSVCVLYRDKRYCEPEHHHYGRNLVEYVAERLRVNPYCTVMCTFPVSDLDVQGDLCPYVVTVAEVPHPENTGINRDRARDIFVLLDPRPLGHKPCFLFLHHPVVHLPSIEAMLGLSTGRSRRLGVMGGNRQGDDVFVEGCAALVLFAEITDEATSVSEAPSPRDDPLLESPSNQFEEARDADGPRPLGLPLHPVTSTALSSPIGEIWEGGAQLTMEGVELFDPTLPPGQSWNEAFLTNATQGMENPMGQDQAPRGTISTVARDALDAAVTRIQALIFVPDFVPEIVDVAIHLPAAIDSLRTMMLLIVTSLLHPHYQAPL
ncbi:hypothetical protein AK812_SmicGene27781 [Symbiodinium microadriaticum]|uniref:Uncharacterized protein n=1 Tax=Symbiodinium microadriaticum TaxID=2951 RepID=A0A1Q9D673_SYMMI|nr:hypothetical protein AK812_SmicGene27781 [Symbiodinium microadriaticum]